MPEYLQFLKLHPAAKLPTRESEYAAGLDICSIEEITIQPGKRAAVKTGLAVSIPPGFYGRIAARSGIAMSYGIDTLAGVIDSDYRGEIVCVLINLGSDPYEIGTGSRIAQLIVEKIIMPKPRWANELDQTDRGGQGFGSTGDS